MNKSKQKMIPWLLLTPILLGMTVFFLIPFGITIYYSVTFGITGRFVGFENYIQVWNSAAFRLAMWNTLRFLLLGVPLLLLLSFGLALLMQWKLVGTNLFQSLLLFPMVIGVSGIVVITQLLFAEEGIVNKVFMVLGIPVVQWLSGTAAFWVLLGLYIWKNFGYNVVLYLAGLNAIPKELYSYAQMEGASYVQSLRYITLPMMVPTFFFVFIMSVIQCFRTYREAFLLAGNHPHKSIYMLQHFLNNNFKNLNYQRLSVAAVCLFIVIAIVVALFYKLQQRYEEAGQ